MTVAELRAVLADLPEDMPVVLSDDMNYAPLITAQPHDWRWDAEERWGVLAHYHDRDAPDVPALILAAREYLF